MILRASEMQAIGLWFATDGTDEKAKSDYDDDTT